MGGPASFVCANGSVSVRMLIQLGLSRLLGHTPGRLLGDLLREIQFSLGCHVPLRFVPQRVRGLQNGVVLRALKRRALGGKTQGAQLIQFRLGAKKPAHAGFDGVWAGREKTD